MKYVRELEGLRGLMALWVILGHWATTLALPYGFLHTKLYNTYAVDIFIILSGFAITALLDKKPEAYRLYITRRLLRIFPVYLFFLCLSVLLAQFVLETWQNSPESFMKERRIEIAQSSIDYFTAHVIAHATALHGLVPPRWLPDTDFAFLSQAWSISLEWQFYLIAPLLIAWLRQPLTMRRGLAAILVAMALALLAKVMPAGFIGAGLYEFVIGIGSFYFLKARFRGVSWARAVPMGPVWAAVIVFCVFMASAQVIPYVVWITVMAAVVLKQEESQPNEGTRPGPGPRLAGMLCSRPAQWFGRMAYSLYLSHMLVIVLALRLLEKLAVREPHAHALALFGIVMPATVLVSWLTYRLIEKPFHEWGRSLGAMPGVVAGTFPVPDKGHRASS